ncbi:hypothetical protein C1646_763035 [Rhizophagus diaphanus]|nr:hypothetical protein C1646_763035 [Rhizophagus diaphanus] [Rhizophagus sp. MUCL 43196]
MFFSVVLYNCNILFEQSFNELHQTLSNDTPPKIEFQESIPPSEDEQEVLKALFAYKASLKESPFFITLTPSSHDIQRYTDQFKKKKTQHLVYFPQELHIVKDKSIRSKKVENVEYENKNEFEKNTNMEQDLKEEEYKEAADYIENYFDDGNDDVFDNDGGGEGEAYFD